MNTETTTAANATYRTSLERMIRRAEARFEADREQAALAADARENARIERMWVAEAAAKRYRRLRETF